MQLAWIPVPATGSDVGLGDFVSARPPVSSAAVAGDSHPVAAVAEDDAHAHLVAAVAEDSVDISEALDGHLDGRALQDADDGDKPFWAEVSEPQSEAFDVTE